MWNDAPLRTKLTLLVLLAVIGGTVVSGIDGAAGHRSWFLLLGMTLVVLALLWLAKHWICLPLDGLIGDLARIEVGKRPQMPATLPLTRRDEVGRIARSVHQLSAQWVRGYHEAHHLRRTLDHRVAKATHEAHPAPSEDVPCAIR